MPAPTRHICHTLIELAKVMNRTDRCVRRWKKLGMPVIRNADGSESYDVAEVMAWRRDQGDKRPSNLEFLPSPEAGGEKGPDGIAPEETQGHWDLKYKKERALREEIRRKKEEGQLISRERVYQEFAARLAVLRADFENFTHDAANALADKLEIPGDRVGEIQEELESHGEDWFTRYGTKEEFVVTVLKDWEGEGDEGDS